MSSAGDRPAGSARNPGAGAAAVPRTPYELLAARPDRSRPFVTSYDGPESCTELSVATTLNAVAKAAGLLRDELGLAPGARLSADLPLHWQLPVWTLAGLSAGLVVGFQDPDSVDVRIVGPLGLAALAAGAEARAEEVLGCACDAFGMPVRAGVPSGVIDVGIAVRAHPDVFQPEPAAPRQAALLLPASDVPPDPADAQRALPAQPIPTSWARLLAEGSADQPGARTWVTAEELAEEGLPLALLLRRAATDPLLRGGSVVLARNLSAADAHRLRAAQGAVPDQATGRSGDLPE